MRNITFKTILTGICAVFFLAESAYATVITYVATDLADTTSGEDLWQFTYTVSDNTFAADTGFTIYFDLELYSNLQDPAPYVNDDWDVITFPPDPCSLVWPQDGMYDAYALTDNASLVDPFTLEFVWLGADTPGAQFFEVYDGITWTVLELGQTTAASAAPIPEPTTIFLMATGLLSGLATFRKKTGNFNFKICERGG